jgi:hypothetical protein
MGTPTLHNLTMGFTASSPHAAAAAAAAAAASEWLGPAASKSEVVAVGIREASNNIDENGNARFVVNGKQILIRGGGWAPDLLQRMSPKRHARMLRLTRCASRRSCLLLSCHAQTFLPSSAS